MFPPRGFFRRKRRSDPGANRTAVYPPGKSYQNQASKRIAARPMATRTAEHDRHVNRGHSLLTAMRRCQPERASGMPVANLRKPVDYSVAAL